MATERHESRRIDNQLREAIGSTGDKGSSRFFLSLEDDLVKMFRGADDTQDSQPTRHEGRRCDRASDAQPLRRGTGRGANFLIRKNILEYDEVMDINGMTS